MKRLLKRGISDKTIILYTKLLKKISKTLTVIVIVALVSTYVPWDLMKASAVEMVSSENSSSETKVQKVNQSDNKIDPSLIPVSFEDVEKRTATEKHFRKVDGTYEAVIYDHAVNYYEDGKWKEIDNTLKDSEQGFENTSNNFKVHLPNKLDDNKSISVKYGQYQISWNINNSNQSDINVISSLEDNSKDMKNVSKSIQKVTYENIFENVNVEYYIVGDSIKENFILNEFSNDFSIVMNINTKGLTLIEKDGTLVFINDTCEVIFDFGQLLMYDHNRNNSFDIKYHINELKKDCYQLTITPNNEWLEKAEYPVTIDPSLNSSTTSLSIHDTYISRQNPTQSYSGDSIMRLSSDSLFYDVNYGLFSFNIPSSVMSKTITYSRLTFNSSFSFMNAQIDLYKNESFFGDSITWNAWNDWDFKHEPYPVDYHIYDGSNQVIFDITKPVKEWQATGNTSTPGFTLKSSSDLTELYTVDYPVAESKPLITIGYEEPAGLKDYWTYTSQDLGMVGTGYVTDYTGNLTFVRNDFHFENELMPLSLSFYFNTSGRSNNIGYGSGWKTNYYMKLQYTTTLKYSLYKPDGNNVYFQNEIYDSVTGTYKSIAEDGSGMTLIRTSNSWKIQTKSNIEYTFDSDGRLIVITDLKTEHHLNVHYVPDLVFNTIWDKIDYVNDEIGNKIQFFYNTQFFKPLQVDLILDCKSVELQLVTETPSVYRTVESRQFYYDSYKNINYITQGFNYGTESSMIVNDYTLQYTFSSSHLLLDAYNENDNYKVTYQYDNINRVDNIEYTDIENGSEVSLGYTSIEYIPTNQTIYTDYKLNSIKYTFDNWGHTINIIDSFGNATFYKYSNPYSGVMNSEYPYVFDIVNAEPDYINTNKLLESSEPLKQQQNYVKNSGFENYLHCWLTGPNGIVNYNSLEKVLGHYSLTVTNELESGSYAYQDVILDTGVYSIQGWIKNNSSTGGASISIISADTIISSKNPINGSDDWQHFELRFKIDSPKTVSIHLLNTSISTAYFDNIQLLEGWYDEEINEFYGTNFIDTRYNILTDNSFEESSSLWSLSNAGVSTIIVPISTPNDTMNKILGGNAVRIIGDSQTYNFASQTVMLYTPNGNNSTIIVGGWARAYSAVPNKGYADGIIDSDDRFFGLEVTVQVDYNAYETYYLPFDPSVRDWQYQMKSITLPEFTFLNGTIQIKGVFQGEGEAYFDNFQVYVDKITTEYSYNDRGNLDTVTEPSGKQTTFEYVESSDQIESITTNDITTGINYGDDLLVDSVIRDNVRVGFHYNEENQVDITTYGIPYGSTITTSTTYTDDFQYIESEKDEFGNEIHYTTNQSISAITEIIDALGTSQELHYDAYGNLSSTSMTADGITIGCSYTYNPDNGKLEEINRNGLIYEVVYDELDRIESLMIAGNTIVSNTYNDDYGYETNLIENQNYANGYGIQFIYDDEDRIHQVKEKNGENDYTIRFVYEYDSSGRLSILKDCNDFASDNYNNIYYYSYDLTGRITNIIDQNSNIISYGYDSQGHVNEYHYIVGDVDNEVYYNYDSTGQYQDTVFNSGSVNYHFDTDELKRLDNIEFLFSSGSVKKVFDYEICYDLGDSNRVSYMYYYQKYSTEENDIYNCKKSWHFQYDSNNNITDIDMNCYDSLSPYTTHKEHYDYRYNGFNEIIRENYDDGTTSFTKVFTYDGNGNIETMKTYEYSTSDTIDENTLLESIEFDYISDRITQITVNGVVNDAFTYDEIGNLLTDGTNSYTWNGKELTQIETSTGTYNYLYNDQGIRTQKEKVNGEITKYYLDGNKVLVETNGTDTIYYTYNFDGSLISMNLNGTEYFYVTNLQGDIIELVAEDGTTVVSYKYDAWGNIVGTPFDISNVDLANKNPYRYRGYHYDNETSLYYCNSRYYNPEIGRWLNADDVSYLDPSSVNGLNLYAYCANNPIMFADPEGNSLIAAIIIGVLVGVATKYTEDVIYNIVIGEKGWDIFVPSSSWGEYIAAGVIGGVTGGIGNYISAATGSAKIGLTALKYSVDILGRPLLNQTFELALGERQNFDLSKYGMDVIYRGISSFTDFIPMPKPKGNFFMKLGMTYYKSMPKVIARSGFRIGKYYGFLPRTLG